MLQRLPSRDRIVHLISVLLARTEARPKNSIVCEPETIIRKLTETLEEDGQVRQWSVHAMMLPTLYC